METNEKITDIEGPYWDFSAITRNARFQRDSAARCIADAVAEGRELEQAKWYVKDYLYWKDIVDAAAFRYDLLQRGDWPESVKWIGWHP